MKQTVYVDVLVGLNLFINYFILLATAKFMSFEVKRGRIILASFLGALYSLYILFPSVNFILSLLIKLLMSVSIVWVAFWGLSVIGLIKAVSCFYLMNFSFCGVVFLLWYFFSTKGSMVHNGIVYFNISPILFFTITVLSYAIIRLGNRIVGSRRQKGLFYNVQISLDGKKTVLWAKIDTGNTLREPFSKIPVAVVEYSCIKNIIPKEQQSLFENYDLKSFEGLSGFSKKYRIIPFNVIGNGGFLPAFKPDEFVIKNGGKRSIAEVYVAVTKDKQFGGEFSALLNPEIVENEFVEVWR